MLRTLEGGTLWVMVAIAALLGLGLVVSLAIQLRRALAARERAELELKRAAIANQEFFYTLLEELNFTLAALGTVIELMRRAADKTVAYSQFRDKLDRQVDRLRNLVNRLLDMNRFVLVDLGVRNTPINLADVIKIACETSRQSIEASKRHLSVTQSRAPLTLLGDEAQLSEVVSNLLLNSAKYTPPGGHIELTTERIGDDAVIRVRDDGKGIPSDMLPREYDLFMQIDRYGSTFPYGLGIGLSLARWLVELHGGTIEAASDGAGRGTTFTVRLPLDIEPGAATAEPRPDAEARS